MKKLIYLFVLVLFVNLSFGQTQHYYQNNVLYCTANYSTTHYYLNGILYCTPVQQVSVSPNVINYQVPQPQYYGNGWNVNQISFDPYYQLNNGWGNNNFYYPRNSPLLQTISNIADRILFPNSWGWNNRGFGNGWGGSNSCCRFSYGHFGSCRW